MPEYTALYSSPRTKTFTSAIASANAYVTSIATAITQATFSGAGLTGAQGTAVLAFAQTVTVTTAAHAGSYKIGAGNAIVVTGTAHDGTVQTENLVLAAVNGGETVSGLLGFKSVSSIVVPGQNDTLGAWTFGVGDLLFAKWARQIRAGAAGNVKVGYEGNFTDTIPCLQGERQDVLAARIYDSGTTAFPLTVYA